MEKMMVMMVKVNIFLFDKSSQLFSELLSVGIAFAFVIHLWMEIWIDC